MCCLKNEEEAYEELNSKLPGVGDFVTTRDNLKGEVQSVSVLKQLVKVIVTMENDEKEVHEYKVEDLRFKQKKKKDKTAAPIDDEELRVLELLEKKEGKSLLDDE
jgi:cell fate regulator YaaT (PSP1 superfamily)